MNALFLNCSLKKSDEESNTEALINQVANELAHQNVVCEQVRLADMQIDYGISDDLGAGDEWPLVIEKIKAADIIVIGTPLWMGDKTSIATKMIERMYGSNHIENDEGHPFYYNKVAGVVVTGNEDGAKHAIASLFFGLSYLGFTVAPESCAYWLGEAGPGPSFIEAEGEKHEFTRNQVKKMAHNLYAYARMHRQFHVPALQK